MDATFKKIVDERNRLNGEIERLETEDFKENLRLATIEESEDDQTKKDDQIKEVKERITRLRQEKSSAQASIDSLNYVIAFCSN